MRKLKKNVGRSSFSEKKTDENLNNKEKHLEKIYSKLNNLNKTVLTSSRQTLSRILYYNEIYKQILKKPGVIMEFGIEYGSTVSLLSKLRGIYEPYNYSRKVIGLDTFKGFTNDLTSYERKNGWKKSDYSTFKNYENFLETLLEFEEKDSPLSNISKFKLIKGDAKNTVKKYLSTNPETVIALAIFDMDVYKPTKYVINHIKKRLFKGSILVFDELNHPDFPGETLALLETLGLNKLKLKSFHGQTFASYAIVE